MAAFVHDTDGQIGLVLGTLSQLRQPSIPIRPEITRLTGISDEMVAGQIFDLDAVRVLLGPASLVIAHHAKFDRPFCESINVAFRDKAWGCSMAEVPWINLGFEGAKLGHLVLQASLFHRGHSPSNDGPALRHLLVSAGQPGSASGPTGLSSTGRRSYGRGLPLKAQ